MSLLDGIANRLGYIPKGHRPQPIRLRSFKAAESGRLTHSWTLRDGSINSELYHQLRPMRARSRDLFANNEFARQFGLLARHNIAGPQGFTFRSRVRRSDTGEVDAVDNALIQDRFREFSKPANFTVTGRLSRAVTEQMLAETLIRDGEILIRKIWDSSLPHGFALQLIDVDRLDIEKNEALNAGTGRRVVMGVELDGWNRPTAYYVLRAHPEGGLYSDASKERHVRIPAEEVIHFFVPMRPEQVRGVPWLHAAMIALWDVGGYREAAIINARVGANKLGFVKGPFDQSGGPERALVTDAEELGYQLNDSEPGEWHVLPEDVEVESYDATYPHAMFADFNKAMLRGAAVGMGAAYFQIAGDHESVNFSTGKIGLLPERDMWRAFQTMFCEGVCDAYYPDWFRVQLMTGRLAPIPSTEESMQRNARPVWRGRRWPSPEPLKDAQADALLMGMRVRGPRRVMEEMGYDADEEWETQAEDEAQLRELGLPVTLPTSVQIVNETEAPDA